MCLQKNIKINNFNIKLNAYIVCFEIFQFFKLLYFIIQ